MRVSANFSALSRTRWYEYLPRFLFGGAVTAFAGIIAKDYGPGIGGLFLAFPAIFPASATLIQKHQEKKEEQAGGRGQRRGRKAAGVDAIGASMGAFGLTAFAFLVWKSIVVLPVWAVLLIATTGWVIVSVSLWWCLRR
ncbi:MAG TPA: hypothetical protein VMB18_00575 [Terriglobales bacterium]|nr:hypothetical protein [Terriglobales bacterium]